MPLLAWWRRLLFRPNQALLPSNGTSLASLLERMSPPLSPPSIFFLSLNLPLLPLYPVLLHLPPPFLFILRPLLIFHLLLEHLRILLLLLDLGHLLFRREVLLSYLCIIRGLLRLLVL